MERGCVVVVDSKCVRGYLDTLLRIKEIRNLSVPCAIARLDGVVFEVVYK
jgi:hypothetical protein